MAMSKAEVSLRKSSKLFTKSMSESKKVNTVSLFNLAEKILKF